MIKKISLIILIFVFTGCSTIGDKLPKRKACTGENNTITDIICKK
tara:strand:- start:2691 stop:2825 length:135 start_codon:yes stop_codon:yes gene_type:complete